jgi:hypothetical protein
VKAFDWLDRLALEDVPRTHRFHSEHPDLLLEQHGQDLVLKTAVMRVHHIQGHLHGIEPELMLRRRLKHVQMD